MTLVNNPHCEIVSLGYVIELCRDYDREHGTYTESYFEGKTLAQYLANRLMEEHENYVGLEVSDEQWLAEPEYLSDPPDYGDVMTVAQFIASCDSMAFIDYDGHGHPMKDGKVNEDIYVKPSRYREIPSNATHIVWFNR